MYYAIEEFAKTLGNARDQMGLSQRQHSALSGVPQSHISKIENGSVDLRMSSLIALGRALELELLLAPRKALPAIKSVVNGNADTPRPAYRLEQDDD